ncbi:Diadenosine tetraphosphatase ApaH/serine/threonine protein phosphatase, PP2A family [Roseateles sp. YR242]|uniref:metallophosphoesterase family protein n=1 Tax=Roseateles sp. YR242 TaxID=1855305 RepID=UPI0008BE5C0C|nr:metallophosphoesterase family protein [Roseateles sp. YR242]SEK37800.1 Diadenosine tetraphosphatase ApaH/serine/threonine protein phosphatase, PP2A family [Roseateles sp. YR242]
MKTALISDLHANREALTAVLAHARAQGVDRFALLGDYVGYGSDPAWVVDQVRALKTDGAIVVVGNHDVAVARGPSPTMNDDARTAIEWTRLRLDAEQLRFLGELPLHQVSDDCLFVHANAFDPAGFAYVQGRLEAMRSLHATDCRFTFCGHMHEPMLYHLSGTGKAGDFRPQPGVAIPLLPNRQWLVIPGACGQPRDGNPAACYAVFDHEQGDLSFQRVPYDVDAAAAAIRAAEGLPPALAERLAQRLLLGR